MEKHFHLARTLTRVERRTQVAKMGRAWRAWGEVVRTEEQAELQALERHFHVAHTVARVLARARERRLLRAWGFWARLAARGAAGRPNVASRGRVSASLPSFPPGLLAAGRSSLGTASNVQGRGTNAAALVSTGTASSRSSSSHTTASVATDQLQLQEQRARRSRAMMYKAGAGAVRGLLRRADARRVFRSWQVWRGATTAHAMREARAILGATRIAELFVEAQENHNARVLHRCWVKWVGWSTTEGRRLEWEAEAASWAVAEEEDKRMKAAAAAKALTAMTNRWEGRALRARLGSWVDAAKVATVGGGSGRDDGDFWTTETAQHGSMSPSGGELMEDAKTPHGRARGEKTLSEMTPSSAAPGSAVSALRRKLRGEGSPGLTALPAPSVETRKSPADSVAPPHRLTVSPPLGLTLPGDSITPTSLLDAQGFRSAKKNAGNDPTPPGSGPASSDQFNYSSSLGSPYRPPPGMAGDESASSVTRREQLETGMPFADTDRHGDDLTHSLDLTTSGESINALRSYSDGRTVSPPPPVGRATVMVTASELADGSPEGSLAAYLSDNSPLLGESYLSSRRGNGGGGASDSFDRRALERTSPEGRAVTSNAGKGRSVGTTGTTPKGRLSRLSSPSLNNGGSSGGKSGRAKSVSFPKSPPYVGGSVGALSLGRVEEKGAGEEVGGGIEKGHAHPSHSRQQESATEEKGLAGVGLEVSEGGEEPRTAEAGAEFRSKIRPQQYQEEEDDEVRVGLEFPAVGSSVMAHTAEDFVDIMTGVLWRWAFKRWARVTRDAAFHKKAAETNLKV